MIGRTVTRVGVPAVLAALLLLAGPATAQQYGAGGDGVSGGGASTSAGTSSGSTSARAQEVILKASGVPTRNGRVAWPVGFQLLRADPRADRLMQQLEAQLQLAVEQVIGGGANPQLLDEIPNTVEALRQLLLADRKRRYSMPQAVYDDAEHFLQTFRRTPQILAASAPAPAGRSGTASR